MSRRDVRLLFFFLVAPPLAFLFPFLLGESHFTGDLLYSFHPWLGFAAQSLQGGSFPLWNPYTSCGEPFLANPQVMIFSPTALLFWLFPFVPAWGGLLLLSQCLLFVSVYLLYRLWFSRRAKNPACPAHGPAVFAALAVAWSGFAVVYWEFPSAVAVLPFTILTVLFTLARNWIFVALSTALMFYAGYIQFAYYAVMLGGLAILASCFRRPVPVRRPLFWCAAVAAGCLLALPQILTSWETVVNSLRTAIGDAEAKAHLLRPVFLVKFLVPDIFNKMAFPFSATAFRADFWPVHWNWLNTFYLGTAPFLLAVAGLARARSRGAIFWAMVLVLSLAVAMGMEPLLSFLRAAFPGMRYMTHFSNILLLTVLAAGGLAVHGFRRTSEGDRLLWVLWAGAAAFTLALAIVPAFRETLLSALLGTETLSADQHRHVASAAWKALGGTLAVGAALLFPARARLPLLTLITFAELWIFGRDLHPTTGADFFHQNVALARKHAGTPYRLTFHPDLIRNPKPLEGSNLREGYQSARQKLFPNLHLPFRVYSTWGYEVFPLQRFGEFRRAIPQEDPFGPKIRFIGGALILSATPLNPPRQLLAQTASVYLYADPTALPRASWVPRARVIPDSRERLEFLSTRWMPESEVVLEEVPSAAPPGPPSGSEAVRWGEWPGRLRAVGDKTPGWLVYSQVHYPGWQAYINGRPTTLHRANHTFMAVETLETPWTVDLVYRPRFLGVGLIVLLGGLVGLGGWSARRLRGGPPA